MIMMTNIMMEMMVMVMMFDVDHDHDASPLPHFTKHVIACQILVADRILITSVATKWHNIGKGRHFVVPELNRKPWLLQPLNIAQRSGNTPHNMMDKPETSQVYPSYRWKMQHSKSWNHRDTLASVSSTHMTAL